MERGFKFATPTLFGYFPYVWDKCQLKKKKEREWCKPAMQFRMLISQVVHSYGKPPETEKALHYRWLPSTRGQYRTGRACPHCLTNPKEISVLANSLNAQRGLLIYLQYFYSQNLHKGILLLQLPPSHQSTSKCSYLSVAHNVFILSAAFSIFVIF